MIEPTTRPPPGNQAHSHPRLSHSDTQRPEAAGDRFPRQSKNSASRPHNPLPNAYFRSLLKVMRNWPPVSITTDKLGSYPKAMRRLKRTRAERHGQAPDVEVPQQPDRGRSWCAQTADIRPTRGFPMGEAASSAETTAQAEDQIAMGQPATQQQREEKDIEEKAMGKPNTRQK